MYITFFGLQEEPFNLTPNPKYLYLSEGHKEALARLKYGAEMRKGLIVLTGDIGSGKTTLILTWVAKKPETQHTAVIINPKIVGKKFVHRICREFAIELDFEECSKADILNLLYEYILKKSYEHILKKSFYEKNFVLIVDDAHELEKEQLDDILLLTKLETHTQKLIQIVLVGLPELTDKLKLDEFRAIRQRIAIQYQLRTFSYSETKNYIFHRLSIAGCTKRDIFKPDAIQRIFQLSKGIPRTISIIASNALLFAYLHGVKKIDHQIIDSSTNESLQKMTDLKGEMKNTEQTEKFFSQIEAKTKSAKKPLGWWKWLMIVFFVILAFMGLIYLALIIINPYNLF